jgi:hypothetical protein
MATCERCWRDADGDPEKYESFLRIRAGGPNGLPECTPEEQAGEDAKLCPNCGRQTIHQHCGDCMVSDCDGYLALPRFRVEGGTVMAVNNHDANPIVCSNDNDVRPTDDTEGSPVGWSIVSIGRDGSILCVSPSGRRKRYQIECQLDGM